MTRYDMSEIIEQALQTHCWSSHGKTLPEVIADAIIEKQPNFDQVNRQLEEASAATPHFYSPGTTQDCSICGTGQFAPQHDVAQWKARAEKAEMSLQDAHQMHDHERDLRRDADTEAEHLRARAERAEAIIAATKKALLP